MTTAEQVVADALPDPALDVLPVLKYAGGKRKLLPELMRRLPHAWNTYHEPFIGGGALFFALASRGLLRLDLHGARIADASPDVINLYRALARDVDGVLECLRPLAVNHQRAPRKCFYDARDERNKLARGLSSDVREPLFWDTYWAALTLYLNRTCFNGLWRVNRAGDFNVPLGDYDHDEIDVLRETALRAAADVLGARSAPKIWAVGIRCCDWREAFNAVHPGDLIFCDPPYLPTSETSNFVGYAMAGFTEVDQRELAEYATDLASRGVHVMVSQADTPLAREMWRRDGLVIDSVDAPRAINSKADARGNVSELIITSEHSHA